MHHLLALCQLWLGIFQVQTTKMRQNWRCLAGVGMVGHFPTFRFGQSHPTDILISHGIHAFDVASSFLHTSVFVQYTLSPLKSQQHQKWKNVQPNKTADHQKKPFSSTAAISRPSDFSVQRPVGCLQSFLFGASQSLLPLISPTFSKVTQLLSKVGVE